MGQKMRLDKYLSNMGKGSRSELRQVLKNGIVSVNGKKVKDGSLKVDVDEDQIVFGDEVVSYQPYCYLMLHKPAGYVSATEDSRLPVVVDLVPEAYRHYEVYPVGRLDIDTEGLLILTNDGHLTHQLLSPKKHVPKVYFARLEKALEPGLETEFEKGIVIDDGYQCMPAILERTKDEKEVLLTIEEGKFHQVKRMFEAVDNKVLYLKRLKMGGVSLDPDLALGDIRPLTEGELAKLQNPGINDFEHDR